MRGVRAGVFTLAALVLAAAAHLAGGGPLPAAPVLVLLAVPLAWGAVALTGRVRGRAAVLAALGVAQLGLHEAFMALAGPSCPDAGAGVAGMAGMHGSGPAPSVCSSTDTMAGMGGHPLAGATVMLAAHVVATVATALMLAYGERLLAALPVLLLALLVAHLSRWVGGIVVPALPRPGRRPRANALRPAVAAAGAVSRRGPPMRAGVAIPA